MGSDKWIKTKIDKIHADPKAQGIVMSKHKLQDLGVNYTPTSIVTDEHVDKNYSAIKSSITKEHRIGVWSEMVRAAWVLITILTIFAALLSVIVLYNLGLLSFTEIERQIATLKVLGFNTGALRGLLLTQNLWFTAIGFALGLPLGDFILKTMWKSVGDSYYVLPYVSLSNFLLTAVITFSLSIIVNLMFSKRIRKLNMVESVKGGE